MIKNISLFTIVIFTLFSFTNQTKPKPVAKKAVAKSTTPAAKKTTKTSVNSKTKKEEILEVSTDFGKMYIWLYNATPLHKANILKLAKSGFYDSTTFHRIIPGFMIQGGDPNSKDNDPYNDGAGGPDYTIPHEIKDTIKHEKGSICAARTGNPAMASSSCQFYICNSTMGTAGLNGQYTVYGMVMKGLDVIDKIIEQPTGQNDRPIKNIVMKVKVLEKTLAQIKTEYGYTPKM